MIPYSVDITGNFVYSPQLIEARKQVQEELLNVAQLLEIENKEIQHIVDTCKQIGLKCVTDGDYRSNGYTDFFRHLQNISKRYMRENRLRQSFFIDTTCHRALYLFDRNYWRRHVCKSSTTVPNDFIS